MVHNEAYHRRRHLAIDDLEEADRIKLDFASDLVTMLLMLVAYHHPVAPPSSSSRRADLRQVVIRRSILYDSFPCN